VIVCEPVPLLVGIYVTMQDPSRTQPVELKMPDPVLPQLTDWPVTGTELVTVAVQVVLAPTGIDVGLQDMTVDVGAVFIVVGLKFAVIVPTPFIVAVVDAEDELTNTIAEDLLTLQLEKAYPALAVADMKIVEPGA
jgi:hypothetical protein